MTDTTETEPTTAEPTPGLQAVTSPAARFLHGMSLPLRGAWFVVRRPRLWPWVVVPVLVSVAMLVGAFAATWSYGDTVSAWFVTEPTGDGAWAWGLWVLWWVGATLIRAAMWLALSVVAFVLSSVLASPFHDQLTARIEAEVHHLPHETFDVRVFAGDVANGVAHSLIALVLWLACALPLLLLPLIPVVGQVLYVALSTFVSSTFLAREVSDYAFSRRRYTFREKFGIVWAERSLTLGVGLTTSVLLLVPLANLLTLPAAVAGGTLMVCELDGSGRLPPRRSTWHPAPGDPEPPGGAGDPPAPT